MTSPRDIIREYFPQAEDDEVDFILWNYTGYPGFWNGNPEQCLRQQVQHLKDVGREVLDAELDAAADDLARLPRAA
jgi:hypothetical protein